MVTWLIAPLLNDRDTERKGVPSSVTLIFMTEEPGRFSFSASQNVAITFKSMHLTLIKGALRLNDEGWNREIKPGNQEPINTRKLAAAEQLESSVMLLQLLKLGSNANIKVAHLLDYMH